jgi:hypothetical protein
MIDQELELQPGHVGPSATADSSVSGSDWMPAKFHASGANGFDLEASARKMAESYSAMERRMGSPAAEMPTSAEGYVVNVPEDMREGFEETEILKGFKDRALAAGLSQTQFDFMMGEYFSIAPNLVRGGLLVDREVAEADLRSVWTTEAQFKKEVAGAHRAFMEFADPRDHGRIDEIGNSPVMLRILAKLSKEMQEASGIPPTAQGGGAASVKELMASPAYTDPKHPDHASTSARVKQHYQRRFGNNEVI